MITIKLGPMTIERKINDLKQLTDTSDGIYIKFIDNVEIIIPIELSPTMKAAIITATRMNSKGFVLDLNNRKNPIQVTM